MDKLNRKGISDWGWFCIMVAIVAIAVSAPFLIGSNPRIECECGLFTQYSGTSVTGLEICFNECKELKE